MLIFFHSLDRIVSRKKPDLRTRNSSFVKPLTEEPDCKASYGGQNCSLRTDKPGFSVNIFSLISGNEVFNFVSIRHHWNKTRLIGDITDQVQVQVQVQVEGITNKLVGFKNHSR